MELLSFSARAQGHDVMLEWTTATELNNDRFDVQRSVDGFDWTTVGSLPGAGTSQLTHAYALLDTSPPTGTDYYRLAQVDLDGGIHYSKIEAVHFDETGEIQVWPQPSDGVFTANIAPGIPVRIIDGTGRAVHFRTWPESPASTGFALEHPAAGPCFIRSSDGALRARVIVQ